MGKFTREALTALVFASSTLGAPASDNATVPASGKLQLTSAVDGTAAGECTVLPAPAKAEVVFWKNDLMSTRRVDAYEFAASWDAVPDATSYTLCYTQNTQSRLGGYNHVYETCFTQPETKLNNGAVFYANNGLVNVTVQANGADPCQRSLRATALQVDTLANVAVVCTEDKVTAEQNGGVDLFNTGDPTQLVVSQVNRTVLKGGASKNTVRLQWTLNPGFFKANARKNNFKLQVCAGATRDWTEQDDAARTTYWCVDQDPEANGVGSADVELPIEDPRAVYISGTVRAMGFCTQDSYETGNKVTIANYFKVKVASPVVSGASGVTSTDISLNSALYLVSTSRTTPDQIIDVNYFGNTLVGASGNWELPVRQTPEGALVHDTYITPVEGVVTMGSSSAGPDTSIALDIYVGETKETAKGAEFAKYSSEQAPDPTMLFTYTANGKNTRIESKAMANTCMAGNPSQDQYQPPFIFEPCSDSAGQLFAIEELVPGWMAAGSQWSTTEYDGFALTWQSASSADAVSTERR